MDLFCALSEYKNSPFFNEGNYRLAIRNDITSIVNIGTDFAQHGNYNYAVVCWLYVVNGGYDNAEAYSNLGVSYYYGNGIEQNFELAISFYKKATDKGNAYGMYNLAVAYENGNGVEKDMGEAIKYYRLAAEKGLI